MRFKTFLIVDTFVSKSETERETKLMVYGDKSESKFGEGYGRER